MPIRDPCTHPPHKDTLVWTSATIKQDSHAQPCRRRPRTPSIGSPERHATSPRPRHALQTALHTSRSSAGLPAGRPATPALADTQRMSGPSRSARLPTPGPSMRRRPAGPGLASLALAILVLALGAEAGCTAGEGSCEGSRPLASSALCSDCWGRAGVAADSTGRVVALPPRQRGRCPPAAVRAGGSCGCGCAHHHSLCMTVGEQLPHATNNSQPAAAPETEVHCPARARSAAPCLQATCSWTW